MEAKLEDFQRINENQSFSVILTFGYIRELHQQIFASNKDTYYDIPTHINQLCSLFYCQQEQWDYCRKGKNVKMANGVLIHTNHGYCTTFMKNIAVDGVHDWYIKVENKSPILRIGIFNNKYSPQDMFDSDTIPANCCYFWSCNLMRLIRHDRINEVDKFYGQQFQENDMIHIHLDLNKLQLSFGLNDTDYGKAFDVKKGKYSVAVTTRVKGMMLQLILYQYYN